MMQLPIWIAMVSILGALLDPINPFLGHGLHLRCGICVGPRTQQQSHHFREPIPCCSVQGGPPILQQRRQRGERGSERQASAKGVEWS
jgi:hypothetical protein